MKAKVETANTNTEGQGNELQILKSISVPYNAYLFPILDLQKLQKKNLVEAENNHQVLLILVTVMENLS